MFKLMCKGTGQCLSYCSKCSFDVGNVGNWWLFLGNEGCALFFVDLLVVQRIELGSWKLTKAQVRITSRDFKKNSRTNNLFLFRTLLCIYRYRTSFSQAVMTWLWLCLSLTSLRHPSLKADSFIPTDAPVASVRNPLHLYTTEVATTLR